jgi:hypothetical protein
MWVDVGRHLRETVQVVLVNALAEAEVERIAPRQARFMREGILKVLGVCSTFSGVSGAQKGDYFSSVGMYLYQVATRQLETLAGVRCKS